MWPASGQRPPRAHPPRSSPRRASIWRACRRQRAAHRRSRRPPPRYAPALGRCSGPLPPAAAARRGCRRPCRLCRPTFPAAAHRG
eukprot:1790636-Prymnesium_polylepis.1